jgi:outer membrane protein OmpA-like peptidoglycan-associated protein/tetratricopeptide (TPR) repeat protein
MLSLLLLSISAIGQTGNKYKSTNKSAIRDFEDGRKHYDSRQDAKAIKLFESAIAKDSGFVDAYAILANIYLESRDFASALEYLELAIKADAAWIPVLNKLAGEICFRMGMYDKARQNFIRYKEVIKSPSAEQISTVDRLIANCDFALEAVKRPVPFSPVNLGSGVNTAEAEYYPSFTVDQREIIFTRDIKDSRAMAGHQEDFYISMLKDTIWQLAKNAGMPLNSGLNEGAPSISADGRILFFTACERPDGKGSCDIYLSQRLNDGTWSKPINLGAPINTEAWESQPSFSSDGKTLYFVRGGYDRDRNRQYDIYMSIFQMDMTWSSPVKLGENINTVLQEESVFIHPDNQTIYFSSTGHTGMGGLDIFLSRRQENGEWGKPVNLGYPINTAADENSLVVSADGKKAYFASDRKGGFGRLDLYSFDLYQDVQPALTSYVKAIVTDAATGNPLSAQFEVVDLSTGKVVLSNTTDKRKGEFLACLPAGRNYMLNVNKESYLFYSDYFELKNANTRQNAFLLNIKLQQPKPGEKVVLRNIFFDVNKFDLKPESTPELTRLVALLKNQPTLKIEISGHTDSSGDKKANQLLSENRAKSVKDFLVQNGIQADRITYKGYGDARPVASNESEEGRAQNRRTEFTIL